jgi:hypothetical protein
MDRKAEIMHVMSKVTLAIASIGLAMLFTSVPPVQAQTTVAPAAPLPSQIIAAKRFFISNTGSGFDSRVWSGNSDRIYNEFYAAVKSSGQFELASAPGDADLVLDVNVVPYSVFWQFKLEILDPKTRIVLWTIYEPLNIGGLQKTRDKNFDGTIDRLAGDLKTLTAQSAATNASR